MFNKLRSLGLGTRIIAITLVMMIVVVTINYIVFVTKFRSTSLKNLAEKAAAFTAVADAAKDEAAILFRTKAFDSPALLAELEEIRKAGRPYTDARIFGTIPVVFGWQSAGKAAEREGIEFHIAAFDARNKKNEPDKGSFREALLRDVIRQTQSGGADGLARIDPASNSLHYMRTIKLTHECMLCHGVRGNEYDTDGDGIDILGFKMEGWKPGDLHGAYEVVMPLNKMDQEVASFITSGLAWTGPIVVGGSALFILLLRVMFNRPVRGLIARVRDIAEGEGDLTLRVNADSKDELGELGRWFNIFIGKIHDIIAEVAGSAREVAAAATEIAASSEEMATSMNEQSSQVTQISSATEQMSASIVEVARKSNDAAKNASDSGKMAEEGGAIVTETIDGMQGISDAVTAGAASVTELGTRSEQIGKIIEVINDIADQTNLLALNAAIEAARAGEHGRGFAVVADEVRKLADRTTKATEEIAGSITAIQTGTGQAVSKMNIGSEQVAVGAKRATEAGESLSRIVASAREVEKMIQSIAAAAEEQSAASEQISRNIEGISAVSRQATEGANQAASAAAQLSSRAEQLQALVGRFKTMPAH